MAENFELHLHVEGPDTKRQLSLPFGAITIGRQPGSDLHLVDHLVSRNHARLVRSAEGCLLMDLGSANKTYVNGKKLEPQVPTPIEPGDTIRIGPYQLRLELVPQPDVPGAEPNDRGSSAADKVSPPVAEPAPEVKKRKDPAADGKIAAPPPLPPPAPVTLPEPWSPVPDGLTIESHHLIKYLPGIYQTGFMKRFLGIFESVLVPIEWTIDNFDLYMNPTTAPVDFLSWLANWFQLTLDSDWSPKQRRMFLQEAHEIYARRGTSWALRRVLEIFTDVTPEIEDLSEDLEPFTFLVRIPNGQHHLKRAQIEALIEANKPAYTTFVLEIM